MRRVRGFTLIEVVASLALLATASAALLVAHARSLEQLRALRDQETASILAREWMATRHMEDRTQDLLTEGAFEQHSRWRWSLTTVPFEVREDRRIERFTLAIRHDHGSGTDAPVQSYAWLEAADERR